MNVASKQEWLYVHRDPEWAAYYDEAGLSIQRRFFDRFLKGVDNGWDAEPAVLVKVYENRTRFHHLNGRRVADCRHRMPPPAPRARPDAHLLNRLRDGLSIDEAGEANLGAIRAAVVS